MTKQVIYKYLGTNGVIESPVYLEDIYYVRLLQLNADPGNVLTNGVIRTSSVRIPENEESQWEEVKA